MTTFKKYLPLFILIITFIVGAFFRFYRLGETPSGFYVDEAALGYNAFSILKTGKDEFGKSLPIMFRSFSTFQSPVYTYLTVPFISLFGLTPFSVRLPSALFGFLTIPLLYLLVRKISPEKYRHSLALISAILLSVSPWHIAYSRTAYETNIALFFLILGSLLFFQGLKKPWLFILSAISFALSFNSYRAETIIIPVLLLSFYFVYRKEILPGKKQFIAPVLLSCLIAFVLILPMLLIIRTPGFQARTSTLNIFSFDNQVPWGYKRGNIPQLASAKEFLSLYTSYFSPRYMFSLGDAGPRKPYPGLGTFFVWQFPLYLIGLYFLLKEKNLRDLRIFIFVLLIVSPIPAALTRDPYSTLRSLPMVVPQILLIAFGLVKLLEWSWPYINKWKYYLILLLIFLSSVKMFISIFYLNDYFRSEYWNYGWPEIAQSLKKLDPKLPVIVDNSHGDVYILLLFFLQYDPATYQKNNFEVNQEMYYTNLNRNPTKDLGSITVKSFQWGIDTEHTDQYIVADGIAISQVQIDYHRLSIIKEVRYPSGEVALRILRTNPRSK